MQKNRKKAINKQKYNNYTLFQIAKHIRYNPNYAIGKLEEYIDTYYDDYYGYLYYIKTLIDTGDFTKAKEVIDLVESVFPNKLDSNLHFHKLRLYTFLEDYETSYQIYNDNKDIFMGIDNKITFFETIYNKQVNNYITPNYLPNKYLYNQIVNYSHNEFINHILKHSADYNQNAKYQNPTIFNSDFPINEVISELKLIIPNDNRTYFSFLNNFYMIKYDNNGKVKNRSTDYFRVVTLHNTNELITMYPMKAGAILPYVDLNYLNTSIDKPKVRTLTQTEKFNKKYNI